MGKDLYDFGSGLSVPGVPEVVVEYGDAASIDAGGHIVDALRINDKTNLEQARLTQITGLHSDPDGRETRSNRSDQHGERAGRQLYSGRTIGLTGKTRAGNLPALRDLYEGLKTPFGNQERDLVVVPPDCSPIFTNEVANPSARTVATGWVADGSATFTPAITDGVGSFKVGRVAITGAVGLTAGYTCPRSWSGEDVFAGIIVKPTVITGSAPALTIKLRQYAAGSLVTSTALATATTPTVGTWYRIQHRFLGSSLDPRTDAVGIEVGIAGGSGNYTVIFEMATVCFLSPTDVAPATPFDGSLPGYQWTGAPETSTAIGPVYAANMVPDPEMSVSLPGGLRYWGTDPGTSGVTNVIPLSSRRQVGTLSRSLYAKMTKDATSTSRHMIIFSANQDLSGGNLGVVMGRRYRLTLVASVLHAAGATGATTSLSWRKNDGSIISATTTTSPVLEGATKSVVVEVVAPDQAHFVEVDAIEVTSTTSSGVLEGLVSDPCLVDITDWDPGAFYGVGTQVEEVPASPSDLSLARRRVRRPFLLRRVRKASDFQESDTQSDANWTRDWTMSVRAGDPAIYVVDERRVGLKLTGTSTFIARQAPDDFVLETDALPLPAGYTYDGTPATSPNTIKYRWSQEAANWHTPIYSVQTTPINHPRGGVGPRLWNGSGSFFDISSSNRPTSGDIKMRAVRTGESLTYLTPRVVLGCAPSGYGVVGDTRKMIVQEGTGPVLYPNFVGVIVKRVSSTVWLELRWNSYSFDAAQANFGSIPGAPHAFELWASHTTSGTQTDTLIDSWDYESYDSSGARYPFDPGVDPMWLVASEVGNTVFWELWRTYPTELDFGNKIESGSHVLTSGHVARYGDAAAGSAGWAMRIPKGSSDIDDNDWASLAARPPFVHYFESSNASQAPTSIVAPTIGSIEMPHVIQLRGDLIDPTITIEVPGMDGSSSQVTTAQLEGTILDSNPVTIDLYDDFTVTDSNGVASDSLLVAGADFASLRPGVNRVTLQARGWGSYPEHMSLRWRDALR